MYVPAKRGLENPMTGLKLLKKKGLNSIRQASRPKVVLSRRLRRLLADSRVLLTMQGRKDRLVSHI